MGKIRWYLIVLALLALLINVSPVFAQVGTPDRDGDGLPDPVDSCPDQPGPRENGGCPVVSTDGAGSNAGPSDSDGDGLNDDTDACPQQPGPVENGGCPLPPEEPTPEPLPQLLLSGPCVMATAGYDPVNIRALAAITAPVVGLMDPHQIYPVHFFVNNPEGERWNQTNGGVAASWVSRLGGECQGLAVLTLNTDEQGKAEIQLVSQLGLSFDELMFNPQPEPPDPDRLFPPETFPFADPEVPGLVLLARFGSESPPDPLLLSMLLPAVQQALPAGDQGESPQVVSVFVNPGTLVGFNPQPEPPASPIQDMYFQVAFETGDVPPEENNAETPMLQMMLTGMNLGELTMETCESSMFPAEGQVCTYAGDMGQVAVCFTSQMTTYCMYNHPPEPG